MSSQPTGDPDDELSADMVRLGNAISCELHAQLAMRGEAILLADVPEVAYTIAMQLRHAFRIEWAPRWVDEGAGDGEDDDAPLGSDAAVFHGSATSDRETPGAADRYPIFDHGWPRRL
ncbi:MAG TPA: hypothetical protein VF657_20055 [Actinoplanes sp.]|jgi:hypothetical protein